MKNKKGMTIAELIVSIVLVSVACIYFFQTIVSINKLYSTVNEDTNLYLHKLYYYRLLMANKNKSFVTSNDDIDKYDLPYSTVYKDGKVVIKDSNGNAIDMPNIANNTDVPDDNSGDDNVSNGDNDDCSDIYCTMYKIGEDEGITEGECVQYSNLNDNSKNLLNKYSDLPKEGASICYISKSDENKENKNNVSETYSYSTKKYEYCVFGVVSSYSNNTNSCKKRKF